MVEGVKNCQFCDDIVYLRPLRGTFKNYVDKILTFLTTVYLNLHLHLYLTIAIKEVHVLQRLESAALPNGHEPF